MFIWAVYYDSQGPESYITFCGCNPSVWPYKQIKVFFPAELYIMFFKVFK